MASTGYGSERYTYKDGIRHRTGFVRTIRPDVSPPETNSAFEQRMDLMCRQLLAMQSVIDVQCTMERRDGSIVQCQIDATYAPRFEAIAEDARPAGGGVAREYGGRGGRGGGGGR
jgi:hypothetical protein